MLEWTAPKLTELNIQLTAKQPGKVERLASWGIGGNWLVSTYAQDVPSSPGTEQLS